MSSSFQLICISCRRASLTSKSLPSKCRWLPTSLFRPFSTKNETIGIEGRQYKTDDWTNVNSQILAQVPRRLYLQQNHPISITRQLIESRFSGFDFHNGISPVVTVEQNFDSLAFPADHPGRSCTDTYYVNRDTVLRTHSSAHELETFRANTNDGYLISADVYRRDAVDRTHYPVFHQLEGARSWDRKKFSSSAALIADIKARTASLPLHDLVVEDPNPTIHPERNPLQPEHSEEEVTAIATDLKRSLEDMVVTIFTAARGAGGSGESAEEPLKVRWVEAYFPFTSPSWELEVFWQGDWLEVLGCGVTRQSILINAGQPDRIGWAFGIGLERIAMLLFNIPDIRLFWSKDERFLSQFQENIDGNGKITTKVSRFQPFSKYPPAPRDVAFWVRSSSSSAGGQPASTSSKDWHENELMELMREIGGDSVEDVRLVDDFTHPKTGRKSLCYRVVYRSLERTLSGDEVNQLHERVTGELVRRFGVEIR